MIHDIDFADYLAHPAISRSKLSALLDSKWHFSAKKAPTSAMNIGTYIHERLLTPWINTFEVEPNVNKRTKAGREEIEAFNERLKASNKMSISPDDKMNADLACNMVRGHDAAAKLLSTSKHFEATVYHNHDGIDLKARFDLLNPDRGWVADVKKTRDASPKAFARDVIKYKYHFQAAFYTWMATQAIGVPIDRFFIIAVEDKEPYGVAVYQLSKEFMERGELLVEQAFDKLHNIDILPRVYSDEIVELDLPGVEMRTSEQIEKLATALSKCQSELRNPAKKANNPFFKSKYADLATVIDSVREAASNNGLSYSSAVSDLDGRLVITTRLLHTSGQWIDDIVPLLGGLGDMQKFGSALTYARRYSIQNLFGITGEIDDDGNSISGDQNSRPYQRQAPPAPPAAPTLSDRRNQTLKAFAKHGVDQGQIENHLKKAITAANGMDLNNLREIYSKLESGEATPESWF